MTSKESTFVRVCSTDELPEGTSKGFRIGHVEIAVVHSEGHYYCIGDICSHEHEHMHDGWLEGDKIECPRHGAQFDLKTGDALSLPATKPVPVYEIRIEGNDVMVAIPV